MKRIHPVYLPTPYQDSAESGRLVLRDGSTATIRPAQPADAAALRAFFERLSPESRYRRFVSVTLPDAELIRTLCDATQPRRQLTLVVVRMVRKEQRIIATGSYFARDGQTAEVALAVEDAFQGKGLGSLVFERLALLAVRHGLTRFWGITHVDNVPMVDIFRHSGFSVQERQGDGCLEVDVSVVPSEASVGRSEMLDRLFTAASLRPFFQPNAVAVVGASRDPASIGYRILETLVRCRFNGPVYPVNPSAGVVGSIRCYPSVRELPEPVDLAIIVVPRDIVLRVVDDCAERGVKALVVITAGFAETGAHGRALQRQLVEKARGYGMRLVGPNCLGLVNTDPQVRLNASFAPAYPPHGRVALMSQSGALGIAILALAQRLQLGLAHFVSVGNKADVSGNDFLQYWEQDAQVGVILLYLESFGNPRRFARIARRVSRAKPIIAVKSGRTPAGQRAAGSHTAALAASDAAVEALFHQTGVLRADTLEELFDVAGVLAYQPLPPGKRVAIVTNAGGPGILCADACETGGLQVAALSAETRKTLTALLSAGASVSNPIDMIAAATPEQYARTVATVLTAPEVDALVVMYIPVGVTRMAEIVEGIKRGIQEGRAGSGARKPVLACLMSEDGVLTPLSVGEERIPTYLFPETAARVLGKVARYAAWRAQPQGRFVDFADAQPAQARNICREALSRRGEGWLTAEETRDVLLAMGLPAAAGGVARTAEEAAALAEQVGFPVAVKLASHTVIHKSEHGGVRLRLQTVQEVRDAFAAIRDRVAQSGALDDMDGVLVQPMVSGGVEVMVGVVHDPSFGPLIAAGLGGIHVEILRDVSFRVTPLTDLDAADMLREIRGYRLLQGYRGHPAADLRALEELLLRVSLLVEEVPEIIELDFNPIMALPPGQGCRIVDARIQVQLEAPAVPATPSTEVTHHAHT